MKKYFFHLIFFVSISLHASQQPLELETFLKQVYESHPNIKQLKLNPRMAYKEIDTAQSKKNWSFNSSTSYTSQQPNDIGFQPISKLKTTSQTFGLTKPIWFSGGQFDIRLSNQLNETKLSESILMFSPDSPSSYYENRLSLSYYQPLWKNLGGNLFKYDSDIAKLSQNLVTLNTNEAVEGFLKGMAFQFLEWAYLHHIHTLIQQRALLAEESLSNTKERFKANLVDKLDILRAKASLKRAQQALFVSKANIDAKTKEISSLSTQSNLNSFYPSKKMFLIQKKALPSQLNINSLRIYKAHLKQLSLNKRSISYLKEQNKPDIGLKIVNSNSAYDKHFESSFKPKKNNLDVQLNYSTLLGKTSQKNQLEQAKLAQLKLTNEEAVIKSQLEAQFLSLTTKLAYYINVLDLGKTQIEISKALTLQEMKHYQQGRSQLFQVIQAQDTELQEKLSYAKYALDYLSYQLELDALLDRLYSN